MGKEELLKILLKERKWKRVKLLLYYFHVDMNTHIHREILFTDIFYNGPKSYTSKFETHVKQFNR